MFLSVLFRFLFYGVGKVSDTVKTCFRMEIFLAVLAHPLSPGYWLCPEGLLSIRQELMCHPKEPGLDLKNTGWMMAVLKQGNDIRYLYYQWSGVGGNWYWKESFVLAVTYLRDNERFHLESLSGGGEHSFDLKVRRNYFTCWLYSFKNIFCVNSFHYYWLVLLLYF